jgi:hypothetical protein
MPNPDDQERKALSIRLHPADRLLARLQGIVNADTGDTEMNHCDADDALIDFVEAFAPEPRGKEIRALWDQIERWYA